MNLKNLEKIFDDKELSIRFLHHVGFIFTKDDKYLEYSLESKPGPLYIFKDTLPYARLYPKLILLATETFNNLFKSINKDELIQDIDFDKNYNTSILFLITAVQNTI